MQRNVAAVSHSPDCRRGITILELLVVAGVSSLLAATLLPAVGSVRESARLLSCTNHQRQIGLALMNYEAQYRTLPPGMQWNLRRSAAYGWAVPLLPFLEQHSLFSRLDLTMDPGANCPATGEELPVFWCPSDISQPRFELFAELGSVGDSGSEALLGEFPTANYFGVWGVSEPDEAEEHDPVTVGEGAFIDTRPVRLAEFERGLSQTLLVGERTMARVPATWFAVDARGEDAACRLLGNAATRPNCDACDECEFASRHPGGANFLWGDGRCSFVSENISREIYRDSAVRAAHDDHSPGD